MEAFRKLVEAAEVSSSWMAKRIFAKYDCATDLGRERAIAEALAFADDLSNPRDANAVLESLSARFGLTDELLEVEFRKLQDKRALEQLSEGVRGAAKKADARMADGEPEQAVQVLQDEVANLQTAYWRAKEPEVLGLDAFLAEKRRRDGMRNPGDLVGYRLNDFAELGNAIMGLQDGLYVIAADPNVGKTAFMVSLALDVLKSNPEAALLFFTMDDSRDVIVNRLLASLTDMRINEVRFNIADEGRRKQLDEAYALLAAWHRAGRLDIHEGIASMSMRRIHQTVRMHPQRQDLVVFIDGLYNVPMEGSYGSIREENIDRANQVKQLVKSYEIPVIVTAEFRKKGREESNAAKKERTLNDIMETGKYGYNADLAILLSPRDPETYKEQDEPIIIADIDKNKLESFRGTMELRFIRARSVMEFEANPKTQP